MAYFLAFVIQVPISAVILIASMFIASWIQSGIDFGTFRHVVPRALVACAGIQIVGLLLSYVPFGWIVLLLVWLKALQVLFRLEIMEALTLAFVNWGLNVLLFFWLQSFLLARAVGT